MKKQLLELLLEMDRQAQFNDDIGDAVKVYRDKLKSILESDGDVIPVYYPVYPYFQPPYRVTVGDDPYRWVITTSSGNTTTIRTIKQ